MNTIEHSPFRVLRECQARSAREQQILSGRDWLFVSALVQFLTALYPLYLWVTELMLVHHDETSAPPAHTQKIACGMLTVSVILLLLWWWAKFAPFRAACAALVFYLMLQGLAAFYQPQHMLDGLASKILVLLGLLMAVRTGYRRRHSA
ncbi:hypothetical protein OH491_12765 [Termitidicoccus mucosus]|uniref:Uncharacterized protein n=1 Tax=Termitidicoccus mucosus TaxID=1184151 RepID=A0A178IGS7_9BACT|nr:hypothetical protein AW736_14700 [Opitutaceae bacterium TSB47]